MGVNESNEPHGGEPESVWVLVGNIVEERPYGPGGHERVSGTRLFRGNARIYLASLRHAYLLRSGPLTSDDPILVLGQHRKSGRWIQSWVRSCHTCNWRVRRLYQPAPLERLRKSKWPGFDLSASSFSDPPDRNSAAAVNALLDALFWANDKHRPFQNWLRALASDSANSTGGPGARWWEFWRRW